MSQANGSVGNMLATQPSDLNMIMGTTGEGGRTPQCCPDCSMRAMAVRPTPNKEIHHS